VRVVAVLIVAAGLAAGATPLADSAAASHRAASLSAENAAFASWSPDGKQIAFVYLSSRKRYRIVRMSSNPARAVHTVLAAKGYCCRQLEWAADGRILVNPDVGLKSVRVQGGGKPKRLFFAGSGCDNSYGCQTYGFILSPNRKYAAAAFGPGQAPNDWQQIGLVKLAPGRKPVVLPPPHTADSYDTPLTFSPDGRQLIFSGFSSSFPPVFSPPTLQAIRLAGGDPVPLTQSGIPGASRVPTDVTHVQWSPDGSWVAYVEEDDTAGNWKLEVVPTTGASTPRELASCAGNFDFSWSPTSKLVTYQCSRLMTVRPDGTHLTNLLKGRRHLLAGSAQWSPDGSRLLFVAGPFSFAYHVWTVRPNGRDLTRRS